MEPQSHTQPPAVVNEITHRMRPLAEGKKD
jgi:hypothetical protein